MAARPDSVVTLSTIDIPTLVIAAEEDTVTPVPNANLLQSKIRDARMAVIPQAGHYSAFERPKEFGRLLSQFLAGLRLVK
jgi:pimeloyl-ACP methyl ester carboxylesterase